MHIDFPRKSNIFAATGDNSSLPTCKWVFLAPERRDAFNSSFKGDRQLQFVHFRNDISVYHCLILT